MTSIWDIPELSLLVLDHVKVDFDEADLLQTCLVSRFVWENIIPIVWEGVPTRHTTIDVLGGFPLHESLHTLKPDDQVCNI